MAANLQAKKPLCAVIDTSVWRAQPLLNTPLGRTLVYTVRRQGGVIGLPEIVENELKPQIVEAGRDSIEKVRGPLGVIHTITGDSNFQIEFPSDDAIGQLVDERLKELTPAIVRGPFSVEHAKAALAMVNAKLPPNDKNQQFKDSAIWQAILSISQKYETILITNDKAFFRDRDPIKGLAENLVADCNKANINASGFFGIGSYRESIRENEPRFDRGHILDLILPVAKPRLELEAENYLCELGDLTNSSVYAFQTGDPDRLAIDYSLTFALAEYFAEKPGKQGYQAQIHGSAYFFVMRDELTDHYIQQIAIRGPGSLFAKTFSDHIHSVEFPRPLEWP
jgi:hypothetical protein